MGFGIEGNLTKIYNNYVKAHPECNVLSTDAIYLRMKEEGVITQEQYNSIKKGLIFDFKSQQPKGSDWKSTFGFETTQQAKNVKQNNNQKRFHPVYKDLQLDSKGKIDMNPFSLESIKKNYPKDKFNIEYKNYNNTENPEFKSTLSITDKNGNKILDINCNYDGIIELTSYKNGKEVNYYEIKNGIVTTGRHIETDGSYVQYVYEDDGKTLKKQVKGNKDGYIMKNYKNGELVEIDDNTKNGVEITKKYSHGILVEEITNKAGNYTHNNVLLNKMKNITQPNKYGYWTINAQNAQDMIKALDKNNIREFLLKFAKIYDTSFREYLSSKGYDTKNKDREKLLNHIEKCLKESSSYNPNKVIKNDQIKNNNYASKNIYDVHYNNKKVVIINKTTGRKSVLDFDKLLKYVKGPEEKIIHMENMQKLPAEILEFYANEGVTLRGNKEFRKQFPNPEQTPVEGVYNPIIETIGLHSEVDIHTYVHELFHAIDNNELGEFESNNKKLNDAFEIGLKRFESAGFIRHTSNKFALYYFSTDAQECWARVGEMLFYGKCAEQDVLKQFWPEFIELEKQAIARIQNKPANERYFD